MRPQQGSQEFLWRPMFRVSRLLLLLPQIHTERIWPFAFPFLLFLERFPFPPSLFLLVARWGGGESREGIFVIFCMVSVCRVYTINHALHAETIYSQLS